MTAPVDLDMLQEVTGGDPLLKQRLMELYCATVERCLAALAEVADHDPRGDWHARVHELRGASVSMCAEPMAGLCAQVEYLPEDAEERRRACELLAEYYMDIRNYLTR